VVAQGTLGGITVLWFLPNAVSIAHAGLAQIVFCLTIAIALVTSPGWNRGFAAQGVAAPDDHILGRFAGVTTAAVFAQILLGATMRHTGAGLAIPDFPLAFGRLLPPHWDAKIAIHFAHRLGAAFVLLIVLTTAGRVFVRHRHCRQLRNPAELLLALVTAQIVLGALTVMSAKEYHINSLHVLTGALVLATSLVLTMRAHGRGICGSQRTPPPTLLLPSTSKPVIGLDH
jgi:cytochrome c oxidase assembly protein subunit 15